MEGNDMNMKNMNFGAVHIPELSLDELSASYRASTWAEIAASWKLSMYLEYPDSKQPIELNSRSLSLGEKEI